MGLLNKLKGGDRRSIGRSDEVAQEVLEKVTKVHPGWLQPFKERFIREVLPMRFAGRFHYRSSFYSQLPVFFQVAPLGGLAEVIAVAALAGPVYRRKKIETLSRLYAKPLRRIDFYYFAGALQQRSGC